MKKTAIIAFLSYAVLLTACFKPDPVTYGCSDMCNVENFTLISDFGGTYHVMEEKDSGWKGHGRMYASFDILETTGPGEYNVRLNDFTPYTAKSILYESSATSEERKADPVCLGQGFFSGSSIYYNIQCMYIHKKGSSTPHELNLIYDEDKSNASHLIFHMAHNAFDDTYKEGVNINDCESAVASMSFPMSQFLKKGTGEIQITIDYTWYKSTGNTLSTETDVFENTTTIYY